MCGSRSECTLFASSVYFGDPCPGVHKYLEVHYQCLPESFKPSASPPALIPLSSTSITSSGTSTANVNTNNNVNHKHSKQQPSNRSHKPNNVVTSLDINGSNNSNNQSRVQSTTTSTASSVVSSFDSFSTEASSSPSSSSSTTTTVMPDDIVSSSPSPSDPDLHSPVIDLSQHHKPHRNNNNNNNHPNPRIQSPHHPSISSPIPTVFGSSSDIIDDYDATTSPLDSDDSSSSSSSTLNSLPLSEPLRLLLTIGCVFGIICLFLTMLSLVLAVFPSNNGNSNSNSLHLHHQLQHPHRALVSSSLRRTSNSSSSSRLELQVKQNLTLCLLITEVLFLTGINVSQSRFFCGIISSTLHYFFLSIFIWLFFDGFTLYLALLKNQESSSSSNNVPFDDLTINHVNNHYSHSQHQFHMQRISCPSPSTSSRNSRPCRSYLLIAYGLPLIIQVISSLMDTGSFLLTTTNPTHCWLRSDKYFVLTFVGPVIAVLSANFLFLAITVVCSNYGSLFSLDNNNSGSQVVISNVNSLNNINKAYSEQQHPVVEASPATSPSSSPGKVSPLRIRLRTSLTVFVVMSLTLTALFVSLCQELPGDELVFTSCLYVFSILNPLQVLVIFVIFSSSSSMAKQNSVKVLTSLGFLEASKSSDNHENHLHSNNQSLSSNSRGFKVDMIPQEPIIPSLPHSSKLNIDVVSPDQQQHQLNQQQESDAVSVGQGSKSYASDYGFRGNLAAAQSSASSALNYRSPVYGSHAGNGSSNLQANTAGSIIRTTGRLGYIHTKQCLQFPCQFPHVVEHVYESIDEDPYIARLLLPIEVSNRHRNVSTAL